MTLVGIGLICLAVAILVHPFSKKRCIQIVEELKHENRMEHAEKVRRCNLEAAENSAKLVERTHRSHADMVERIHRIREDDEPWKQ